MEYLCRLLAAASCARRDRRLRSNPYASTRPRPRVSALIVPATDHGDDGRKTRLLRGARRRAVGHRKADFGGLPEAGDEVPPGPQSGRRGGGRALQGGGRGLRGAQPRGEAGRATIATATPAWKGAARRSSATSTTSSRPSATSSATACSATFRRRTGPAGSAADPGRTSARRDAGTRRGGSRASRRAIEFERHEFCPTCHGSGAQAGHDSRRSAATAAAAARWCSRPGFFRSRRPALRAAARAR